MKRPEWGFFAGFFRVVTVLFVLDTLLVTAATVAAPLALLFAGGLWALLSGLIVSTYNQSAPHDEKLNIINVIGLGSRQHYSCLVLTY